MGYDLRSALHRYSRDTHVDSTAIDAALVITRVRRRRAVRTATTGLVSTAAIAIVAASAYAITAGPTTDPATVAPVTSPTASDPIPTQEPTPTPPATPAPTSPPPPESTPSQTDPRPVDKPVFRTDGRVADFAARAPETEVIACLTTYLGVAPEITAPEGACEVPFQPPGRVVEWPGTGVGLRIRTTDDVGNVVDPYVAAWTLMEPSGTLGLATDAGLTAGAPRDRVRELYPDATQGEQEISGSLTSWYAVTDDGGDLLVIGAGQDPSYRIESGYGCGE